MTNSGGTFCHNIKPRECFCAQCSGGFRGGSGGSLEPPSGTKLLQFHWEIEKSGKMYVDNVPLLMDLNPPSRNPGSAPAMPGFTGVCV